MRYLLIGLTTLTSGSALAHQPTISDGTATSSESALFLEDIDLSRVVYHEATADAQQLWIEFEIAEPQSVFVSLGVPVIDRLAEYRPAFVVLGPGLPAVELPFDVPDGLGGLLFTTDGVPDPVVFDEPFSRTSSWILCEEDIELPEAGTYFIVAFAPSGEEGKLWIAPGDREEFSLADIPELNQILPEVQAFHETAGGSFPCFLFPVLGLMGLLTCCHRVDGPSARSRFEAPHDRARGRATS